MKLTFQRWMLTMEPQMFNPEPWWRSCPGAIEAYPGVVKAHPESLSLLEPPVFAASDASSGAVEADMEHLLATEILKGPRSSPHPEATI
jgi:hypothetical protein